MEKAILNAKAALNGKEELGSLVKRSAKAGKHHRNVSFASLMDEKTAETSLSISRHASIACAPNSKNAPFITGDITLDGKDESAMAGKAPKGKGMENGYIPIPDGKNEPVRVGSDEHVLNPVISLPLRQDAALLAWVEKKSLPLPEGTESAPSPIPAAKTTGISINNMIWPSGSLPAENAHQADPMPAENAVREAAALSPSFLSTAGKAALQEDLKHFPETAISNEAEKPVIKKEAAVNASTITVARTDSPHPEAALSSDTDSTSEGKKARPTETGFINRGAEIMRQKDNVPSADSILADRRRLFVSNQDNKPQISTPKEALLISPEVQASVPSGNEKGTAMKQTAPDLVRPAHSARISERDGLALRTEMANIYSSLETHVPVADGPVGMNTQAVIDKILDVKQAMNNDFGRVRIVLDPPNLGTVDLEIIVRKERVEIVITADNASTQQVLQSRADDIRTALQRQDLKIETFQVLLQDPATNQQQAHGGAMFEQRQERQARQNNIEDSVPIPSVLPIMAESGQANGLVSVFV